MNGNDEEYVFQVPSQKKVKSGGGSQVNANREDLAQSKVKSQRELEEEERQSRELIERLLAEEEEMHIQQLIE